MRGFFHGFGDEKVHAFFGAAGAKKFDGDGFFASIQGCGEGQEIIFTRGVRFLCQRGMHGEAGILIEGWQCGKDEILQLGVA